MDKELLLEVELTNSNEMTSPQDQEHLAKMISIISEMNIVEFESLLDEDLNINLSEEKKSGKYQALAILRDLFFAYKDGGDTKVFVEPGICGYGSCDRNCKIINLQGNNTGRNFAFGLDEEDGSIVNFHTCYAFVDRKNTPKVVDGDLMINVVKKEIELKGGDTSGIDDSVRDTLMSVVRSFYKA